jgi:hypothetical protein
VIIMNVIKSSKTKSGLNQRTKKHLNIKSFKCNYNECDISFVTLSQLKSHSNVISMNVIKFFTSSELKTHSKTHNK